MKILATFFTALAAVAFTSVSHGQTVTGTATYFPVKLTATLEVQGSNDKVASISITTAKILKAEAIASGTTGDTAKNFALLTDTNNNVSVIRTSGSNAGEIVAAIISGSGTSTSALVSKSKSGATATLFTTAGKTLATPQTPNNDGTVNLSYSVKKSSVAVFTGASASFFGGSPATSGTGTITLPITTVPPGTAYLVKGSYKTSGKPISLPTLSGTSVIP